MAKKTRTELSTEAVTTNLPDNNQELITPATERAQLASERESTLNYKDDITGTVGQALVVGADGESIEFEDLTTGNVSVAGSSTSNRVAVWLSGTDLQTTSPISIAAQQLILLAQTASSHNIGGGNLYKPPNEGGTRVTGINNTGFGYLNLNNVLAGTRNIALGYNSGSAITSGSNNVVIGSDPGASIATLSNHIIISDGDGNIRQTFDNSGAATFSSSVASTWHSVNGAIPSSAASTGYIDYSGGTRFFSVGVSGSTKGTFTFIAKGADDSSITPLAIASTGAATFSNNVNITRNSNAGSGSLFPRAEVINTNPTQGDGSSTYNFADIRLSSGNGAVDLYVGSSYAAGTWEPQGSINVAQAYPLVFKTSNTERMRITSGGVLQANYGISFPTPSPASSGTPNASSVLDAYEEGSWTPSVISSGTNPTVTYIGRSGNYVRIGKSISVWGKIQISASTGGTGSLIISGLPYTVNVGADECGGSIGLALGFTVNPTVLQADGGTTIVYVMANVANSNITDLDFAYLYFNINYLI